VDKLGRQASPDRGADMSPSAPKAITKKEIKNLAKLVWVIQNPDYFNLFPGFFALWC
jgi:hypothetical protein